MKKDLPSVYANEIDKKIDNNEKVSYSKESEKEETTVKKEFSQAEIRKKLNSIFNSPNYIYKADVDIKLKSGHVTKRIIGMNRNHLITIDNELILIDDILDINYKNKI